MNENNLIFFGTKDTAKITGLSIRQLQYWDNSNLISPSIERSRGTRRLYTESDLFRLKVVKKLLYSGMSVQNVRRSLNFLKSLLDGHRPNELILVSDGHSIYAYKDTDTILDTLREGQQIFRLTLSEVAAEMKREIDELLDSNNKHEGAHKLEPSILGIKG